MTQSPTSTLLRNVRAVLPERVSEKTNILIQDGYISHIFESHAAEAGVLAARAEKISTIDLDGVTVYPGFVDVHIHGAVGVDTMEADAEGLDRVSRFLATQGVTGWLPTLVPGPGADYARAVSAIDVTMNEQDQAAGSAGILPALALPGARVLGVHYEGPFVSSAQCGALRGEYFKTYSGPGDLEDLPLPAARRAARMITLAPEIDGGVELVRELKQRGWVVSIGHTRAGFELLDQAFGAGARHMTHFMNAMAPMHHRAPGPIAWGLSHDEVTCDIIADGVHLDCQMLKLLLKLKGAERLTLISDAIAASGQGDGDYQIWGETITVKDSRTSNARGTIAGSVITMLDAVRLMLSLHASEVDVARMASTNPARLLGMDGDRGSIEEGKRAYLVALDQEGNVRYTIIGGHLAFSSQS